MRPNHLSKTLTISAIAFTLVIGPVQSSVTAQEIPMGTEVAWSPDSQMFAVAYGSKVQIIDITTGNLLNSTPDFVDKIYQIAWSPTSTRFAVAVGREVQIWDISSRQPSTVFAGHQQDDVSSIGWSPNGEQIVSSSRQHALVWQVETGLLLHEFSHDPGPLLSASWSPDGTRIATAGFDSQILLWDAATGQLLGGISIPRLSGIIAVDTPIWNPSGALLAAATSDSAVRVWDGISPHPSEETAFLGLTDVTTALAWNPNNRDLARAGLNGEISIWDTQTGDLIASIGTDVAVKALTYSPYGGRLAFGSTIPSDTAVSATVQSEIKEVVQSLANGAVQIVVPAPSLERLQAIAEACNAPAAVKALLPTSDVASQLSTFVAEIAALPENTIPSGCAADLLAVAEALQNQ